jgi:hypothetical protein
LFRALVRPESVFFLLVWSSFLFLFRERGFYDPGSLWHIRVGELILDHGFMWTDPFTYTFAGHTWIPQQWGAEMLMALAHRVDGLDTMLLGFSTLVAVLFTWVFSRMRAAGMHPLLAGVVTGGCLFAGSFHFFVRPHMFTIALLGWTMGCLVDFDRGRASIARLAGLIPLYILWTNLHGGVLGGVFTLGLAVAGWGMLFLLKQDSPIRSWRTAWLLVGIVACCALTPFVNPFGMEMIHTWQRIVGSTVLKDVVNEHKPINLAHAVDQMMVGCGICYLLLLAGTLPHRPRVTWLIPIVWFVLTFKGIRQGPLFVITAAVALADFWPHTVWHRLLQRYGDSLVHDPTVRRDSQPSGIIVRVLPFTLPVLAIFVALVLQIRAVPVPVVGHGWVRLAPTHTPLTLTDTLKEYAHTAEPKARIYNDANLGGYLIYHVPELKIFMDDRFELYGDGWTREYMDTYLKTPERIEEYMDRYNLELALVVTSPDGMPLDKYLSTSPRWREIGRAECAVLYRRIKP